MLRAMLFVLGMGRELEGIEHVVMLEALLRVS